MFLSRVRMLLSFRTIFSCYYSSRFPLIFVSYISSLNLCIDVYPPVWSSVLALISCKEYHRVTDFVLVTIRLSQSAVYLT